MDDTTFDAELKHLGAAFADAAIDRERYRRELAALLQRRFACSRVGLWRIFGGSGERVMRCLARHDAGTGYSPGGEAIHEHDYRAYFSRLVSDGVYVAEDTWSDPVLAPMCEPYLVPSNVRSLMDAAFTLNGQTFGVVCCEQIGEQRQWTPAEVRLLKRSAALITLHTARHERGEAAWWENLGDVG
jgi:GAF domain-containing protein